MSSASPDSPAAGSAPSPRLLYLTAGALFTGLSLQTTAYSLQFAWPWSAYWLLLLAFPPAVLLARLVFAPKENRVQPLRFGLDYAFAALALCAFLSAALSGTGRDIAVPWLESLHALWVPFSALALVYVLSPVFSRTPEPACRLTPLLLSILAALLCGWGLLTYAAEFLPTLAAQDALGHSGYDALYRAFQSTGVSLHPFGHANYVAAFAAVCLPWLLPLWASGSLPRRVLALCCVLLYVATLLVTGSRGAVLGVAAAIVASLLASRANRFLKALAYASLAAATLAVTLLLARAVLSTSLESDSDRLALLKAGLQLGADRWWLGQGPSLTPTAFYGVRSSVVTQLENVLQLHSTPIQLWADGGLPLLLATASALALVVLLVVRTLRAPAFRSLPQPQQALFHAAWLSLLAAAVTALFDFALDVPQIALLLAVDLACLVGLAALVRPSPAPVRRSATYAALALPVLALLLLPASYRVLRAQSDFDTALQALDDGDLPTFQRLCRTAYEADPGNVYYLNQLGWGLAELGPAIAPPPERKAWRARGIAVLQESLAANPQQPFCHYNLGWLFLNTDPARAEYHFREAARYAPRKHDVYLGLAQALLRQGKKDAALTALALECVNQPAFLIHPFWTRLELSNPRICADRILLVTATLRQTTTPGSGRERGLAYLLAFGRWWFGDDAALPEMAATATTPEQRRFAENLQGLQRNQPVPASERDVIAVFAQAAATRPAAQAEARLLNYAVEHNGPALSKDVRTALLERLLRPGTGPREWLAPPTRDEPALVFSSRNSRPALGILARNTGGLVPLDFHTTQQNALAALCFPAVLPAPPPVDDLLLRSLETLPPTPKP